MTRSIARASLLVCCVVSGCDGGADGPPSRVEFAATWESSSVPGATLDNHCLSLDAISGVIMDFDAETPFRGSRACEAAVEDGDAWLVVCPAVGVYLREEFRVGFARDTGTATVYETASATNCWDVFRMVSLTAE